MKSLEISGDNAPSDEGLSKDQALLGNAHADGHLDGRISERHARGGHFGQVSTWRTDLGRGPVGSSHRPNPRSEREPMLDLHNPPEMLSPASESCALVSV